MNRLQIAFLAAATAFASSSVSQGVVFEPGRYGLQDFLTQCAEGAGVDVARLTAFAGAEELNLQTRMELDRPQCDRVLNAMLDASGNPGGAPIERRFAMPNAAATQLATMLRPMVLPGSACITTDDGGLLVEGTASAVEWATRLVTEFSAPNAASVASAAQRTTELRIERDHALSLGAGDYEVTDLIDRCAAYLGQNIVYSKHDVGGTAAVTLKQPLRLDAEACEKSLRHLLGSRGLIIIDLARELELFQAIALDSPRGALVLQHARRMPPADVLASQDVPELTLSRVAIEDDSAVSRLREVATASERPLVFSSALDGSVVLCGLKADVAAAITAVTKHR